MAQPPPLAASSPVFKQLEEVLRTPEPMCLVIITLVGEGDITAAAEARMRNNMRPYDQLWRIDDRSYAMTMKTLADASIMDSRIETIFLALSDPYPVDDTFIQAKVRLGAAIRQPQDTPACLLERVGEALAETEQGGCRAPVLR